MDCVKHDSLGSRCFRFYESFKAEQKSTLLSSVDGGINWKEVSDIPDLPPQGKKITCIGKNKQSMCMIYPFRYDGKNGLMISRDGGEHWAMKNTEKEMYLNVTCGGTGASDTICMGPVEDNKKYVITTDGGKNWELRSLPNASPDDIYYHVSAAVAE
jgi:photosystem II stability/assembly factor-like uncharacterized protein